MTATIDSAVAPLFVPATRADRIGKAGASGTDAVIADFEDAVAAEQRPTARATLGDYLDEHADTRIVLPKIEDTATLARAERRLKTAKR